MEKSRLIFSSNVRVRIQLQPELLIQLQPGIPLEVVHKLVPLYFASADSDSGQGLTCSLTKSVESTISLISS